jgi:sporulation protein YlmC with PRC-barrel domain
MSHQGTLSNYSFSEATEDIRGAKLYGVGDEKLGKIDDVIFDHSTGNIHYVVVDTGGWLSTKKFIVPANRLRASDKHEGDFTVDLTKEQIESFPPYNEKDLASENKWADYEGEYRAKWETGPVMHRAETDRNITPTTQQLQGNPVSTQRAGGSNASQRLTTGPIGSSDPAQAASRASERVVPAGTDSVVIGNSASGIGGRWDTFQARLRERRKEAVAACTSCSIGSATSKGSESADTLKKAV